MYIQIMFFVLILWGFSLIIFGLLPQPSWRVKKAVRARAGKKETPTQILTNKIAVKLLPFIQLEPVTAQRLRQSLQTVGRTESPELYHAKAWALGIIYGLAMLPCVYITRWLVLLCFAMAFWGRKQLLQDVEKQVKEHREAVEWELSQFAGTVHRSLDHVKSIVDILRSYQRVAGPALKREITYTLNDMSTGDHEIAITKMAARINSSSFTQLAQGLVGIVQGEDQRSYMQMLSNDFSKEQRKRRQKIMLKRPQKLTVNNVMMLLGMVVMLSIGIIYEVSDAGSFFL